MRVFLAVEVEEGIKARIGELIEEFEKGGFDVKWVEPENLHLTLKFLGEVSEDDVKVIVKEATAIAKNTRPFRVSFQGAGFFGSSSHLKVVWVGVKEGEGKVLELMEEMNRKLDTIRKDSYPPSAHLTLGRVRPGKNRELLLRKLEELKDVKMGEMEVKEIRLKQSVLGRRGPTYSDVGVFPLG